MPPWWARGGHAQTIWSHLLAENPDSVGGERIEVPLDDGEKIVLRLCRGKSRTIVYLFHGLSGDASADYMQRSAATFLADGHTVCLVNHRGCGEGEGLAIRPYHSGRGEDISAVIKWGRAFFPDKRHIAVGFSLSGNAILCLLSGLRGQILPDAAISINAPIDLKGTAHALESGINRIYDRRFVGRLRQRLHRRHQLGYTTERFSIPRGTTLRDFDNIYTANAGGFEDGEDYYRKCSTAPHLEKISVPTLLLTAADDPFVPVKAYQESQLSKSVHLHIEKTGGHMGYFNSEKLNGQPRAWLNYALRNCVGAADRAFFP